MSEQQDTKRTCPANTPQRGNGRDRKLNPGLLPDYAATAKYKISFRITVVQACVLLLACVLLWYTPAAHATKEIFQNGSNLRFRHLTLKDGLVQSSVQAIVQDNQGFMWLGTENGLQRYDGYQFITYRHEPDNPNSLSDSNIFALARTANNDLWIGTADGGLNFLKEGTNRFIHFEHKQNDPGTLINNSILALYVSRNGELWIGTSKGLDKYNKQNGEFQHYRIISSKPNANSIYALFEDRQGILWVGTAHGLFRYDKAKDRLIPFASIVHLDDRGTSKVLSGNPISTITQSADGTLWVGTNRGLYGFSADGHKSHHYQHKPTGMSTLPSNRVWALLADESGNIWVGTYGGGLSVIQEKTGAYTIMQHDATDPDGLNKNQIISLYKDAGGLIWIGTDTGGVNIYNPRTGVYGYYRHKQGDSNSLAGNIVWSIYQSPNRTIWVATDRGLTKMSRDRGHYKQYKLDDRPKKYQENNAVYALHAGNKGKLWAGTDYGLYEYIPATDSFRRISLVPKNGNPYGNSITGITGGAANHLWIATTNGLVDLNYKTGSKKRYLHSPGAHDSLPDNFVQAMCKAPDGSLWVGTPKGLGHFNLTTGKFRNYSATQDGGNALSDDSILSCLPAPDGKLWVGTGSGLDLLYIATGRVVQYTTKSGLPDNTIYALAYDNSHNLWISTNHGLSRLDPVSMKFRNYFEEDGLQGNEFNAGAVFAAPDGELFFGGINGLTAFNPANLEFSERAPKVVITGLSIQGKRVHLEGADGKLKNVDIPYYKRFIKVYFASTNYEAPSNNQFEYMLEGFDKKWYKLTNSHSATYTNLDPGHYVLYVKGSNAGEIWSKHGATLDINILPPIWRTWWAYLIYAALFLAASGATIKLFTHQINNANALQQENERRNLAEKLHGFVHAVSSLKDNAQICNRLFDSLCETAHFDGAAFYTIGPEGLEMLTSRGCANSYKKILVRHPLENSPVLSRLRETHSPVVLTDDEAAGLYSDKNLYMSGSYLAILLNTDKNTPRLLIVFRESSVFEPDVVELYATIATQVNIAFDNANLIRELKRLAVTDELTKLYNRRYFIERADEELYTTKRYNRNLSVLLLDIDNFKLVNDNYGHRIGDRLLCSISDAIRDELRNTDILSRYGGEEFAVLLRETPKNEAASIAERIRTSVEALIVRCDGHEIGATISIGVAALETNDHGISDLIARADKLLYKAKRSGRNAVMAA